MEEKNIIEKFMAENFGFVHLKGFQYLALACTLYPSCMMDIYKAVANEFNTTPGRVERNIRHYKDKIKYYKLSCVVSENFPNKELMAAIRYSCGLNN